MAEKIDKNEYVDNSKVFFDFLLHTHQWSNITPVEYAKWLSNFNDIPDGQYIACRLLNRFLYYSDKDIKKLLVDAINDVYSQQVVLPLQLSKDFSSLPSENEYEINEAIKRTLFIPLTPWGDPGASGLYIMRCIHNYYKPRVQSCHVSEVIDSMSAPYDRIVIVDDFVGSGEQFADFWETAEIKDGTLLRDWCCSHQIQANYLALIGYEKTLTELETSLQHSVIMFIINILLTKIRVARLFLSYVKPLEYLNRTPYGKYEFYSKTFPAAMIPGMAARNKSNEVIVPFLGFDGDRLNNILEGMDYDEVCPIIGFPSDNPYWQFESLRNCMLVLKHTASEQKIRKCKANSVFDALQTLDGILTDHPSRNFVLIPLGTRPHSAACAIFASRCQNVRIIYDYAQESPVCSRGVRSATIYNVSQYLKN